VHLWTPPLESGTFVAMAWSQNYDPLHSAFLSTLLAALPLVALLGLLAAKRVRAHVAALIALALALLVAIGPIGMPAGTALRAAAFGGAYGLFPIGWIILHVIFLYHLAEERGVFVRLQRGITGITPDRRLQLVLVAFCFGAFFEGAAGFGTPVAITGAILIGLGFPPLQASALSLIANTAPVAFGALGTPVIALQSVTGLDLHDLSAMVGRQLPFFSVLIPFWLVWAYAGFRAMREIWPALLVAGLSFAIPQFLVSNFHGPWLVDIVASACSMGSLALYLRLTRAASAIPAGVPDHLASDTGKVTTPFVSSGTADERPTLRDYMPWIILSVIVFCWGIPQIKDLLNGISSPKLAIAGLHELVQRVPPVVAKPSHEAAVFTFNWLSATGTAILIAALISGLTLGYRLSQMARVYWRTLLVVRHSLLTIAAMLALGYTTRYSGEDAILGLAFAHTGLLYPFFGTMLGWLGVALTGSDTSSNVLFGSLQRITSEQLGLNPTLMAAANSSGGVMGKMIDAQSIVVASTATRWFGQEWRILRYVFFHSLALAMLVGVLVLLQQYVYPFTRMLVR
jgi:lactate permease